MHVCVCVRLRLDLKNYFYRQGYVAHASFSILTNIIR